MPLPQPTAEPAPPLPADLVARFAGIVGARYAITDPNDQAPYLRDDRGLYHVRTPLVLRPDSTEEVAAILKLASETRTPVVPQGGATGLVGGHIPFEAGAEIVLSLNRMTRVRALDTFGNTMTVDAGITLQQAQEAAEEAGRLFPLNIGSKGSCTIGGNLSTNAGGTQAIAYGMARDLVLGLEVVLADGRIWHGLRTLKKDNTGYDLKHLFMGAEGTLGVITGAVLKLYPKPRSRQTAFVAVASPAEALALLNAARGQLDANLTAFELISDVCVDLVLRHNPDCRRPLATPAPWYVLMETSDGRPAEASRESIEAVLESVLEQGLVLDAALAANLSQANDFWQIRERISEAQAAEGKNIKHDISVPISRIADFIEQTQAELLAAHPGIRMVVFGHLGDGNLHYNVSPPAGADAGGGEAFLARQDAINRLAHDAVHRFDGSISAEHGLGVLRRDESARYKSPVELAMMRAVKQALDPQGLMNPGKVLPPVGDPGRAQQPVGEPG